MNINKENTLIEAEKLWKTGFNCSETVVRAFSTTHLLKDADLETLFLVARGFGNGLGRRQGDCGALSGAMIIINMVFGSKFEKNHGLYKIGGAFTRQFLEKFGSLNCTELKKVQRKNCKEITIGTVEILSEFINNEYNKIS